MASTELGIIDQLLFDIGQFIAGVFNRLADNIQAAFDFVLTGIANLINSITNSLQAAVNSLAATIGDIFGKIGEFIEITVDRIVAFIDNILSDIIAGIRSLIDQAATFLRDMTSAIVDFIEGLIERATDFLRNLFDTIMESIIGIVDKVKALFTDIFDKVVTNIQLIVDRVKLFFGDLFEVVAGGIRAVIDKAGDVVGAIVQAVKDFIASVVDVIGSSLRSLLEKIADLPSVLTAFSDAVVESAKINIGDPLTALPLKFIEDIVETVGGAPLAQIDKMQLDSLNMVFGTSPVAQTPEQMRDLIQRFMPENPLVKAIVVILVTVIIIPQTLIGVANANSQIILQEHALVNPYRLMDPADIVRARHFDLIDNALAVSWLRKTGYTESVAQSIVDIGEIVPPEGEQISWWLRDIINEEQLDGGLQKAGWTPSSITNLKQAAFFIPPVQDLISMAVREVFTPEVAARFGQFEDFPEDFAKFGKQQGISEEWARNYWGAHWALPSVQMGFEMLHRGVIEEKDLALLLRASDVMPFWRDKLIDISFSPLTRIDIRRMHKVGVLSEAEVNKAYHDIGYSDENADRLTAFTLELNKDREIEDDGDLTQLTRANIVALFSDGVFDRVTAQALLEGIGLSVASAELFLESAELDLQRQQRKDEISIILDQAEFGTITFEEAQDKLNALGLETLEIELALLKLRQQEARRNKLPSQAQLTKMLQGGIIQKGEYLETLQRLGFSQLWAKRLLKLVAG